MSMWKNIDGFGARYEVSDRGDVRNKKTGRILKQRLSDYGYKVVGLSFNGKQKEVKVHRLVASAFIPNQNKKPQVNHKNGVKTDNRYENLEWVDNSENVRHCYDNLREGGCSGRPKPIVCVETGIIYDSISTAAKAFGVCGRTIQRAIGDNVHSACGFHWKFL